MCHTVFCQGVGGKHAIRNTLNNVAWAGFHSIFTFENHFPPGNRLPIIALQGAASLKDPNIQAALCAGVSTILSILFVLPVLSRFQFTI